MSDSGEQLWSGHSGRMLGVLSLGLATIRLGRRVLPPLLPTIIVALSITAFEAGIALSIATIGFAALQFPSGRLSDRLTRKTVMLLSLSLIAVGALMLSLTATYVALLIGVAIMGIGEGLFGAADRGLLSDLFVEKRGVAFGIHTTFSDVGGIAAAGLATAALAIGVWQVAFLPAVVAALLIATLLYWWGREPVVLERVSLDIRETSGRLFLQRRFRWLLLAYSLFSFVSTGVVSFLPALLQADHGYSATLASVAFAGMFATGLVTRPLAGRLSDLMSRMVIAGSGLLLGVAGLLVLVTAISPLMAAVGVVVFAAGQKAFPPTMQAYLMDAFPDGSMAGDLGATRMVYIGVGGIGPAYVGFVASRASFTLAFVGFVVAFLLAGTIVLGLHLSE